MYMYMYIYIYVEMSKHVDIWRYRYIEKCRYVDFTCLFLTFKKQNLTTTDLFLVSNLRLFVSFELIYMYIVYCRGQLAPCRGHF